MIEILNKQRSTLHQCNNNRLKSCKPINVKILRIFVKFFQYFSKLSSYFFVILSLTWALYLVFYLNTVLVPTMVFLNHLQHPKIKACHTRLKYVSEAFIVFFLAYIFKVFCKLFGVVCFQGCLSHNEAPIMCVHFSKNSTLRNLAFLKDHV